MAWISEFESDNRFVLLDAAGSTAPSLARHRPSFVALSLLKLTGAHGGALLIRRDRIGILRDPPPSGGTVLYSCARTGEYRLLPQIQARLEGGTPSYIDLGVALAGLRVRACIGREEEIRERLDRIARDFERELRGLVHRNGSSLVRFAPEREESFGPTFSFNLYDSGGRLISNYDVAYCFGVFSVVARFGGHCNPGSGLPALGWSPDEMKLLAQQNERFGKCITNLCTISQRAVGTIRVSFGATTLPEDVSKFVRILREQFLDGGPSPVIGKIIAPMTIEKIFVFPIGGALGFEVENWEMSDMGLKFDRQWRLVDPDGASIATAGCPRLVFLRARIDENQLVLSSREGGEVKLPIDNFESNLNVPEAVAKHGRVYPADVSDFLYGVLGRYVFLVRAQQRQAGRMPFSAATRESISFVGPSFDIRRLRVNFLLAGAPAFSEEGELSGALTLSGRPITEWKWRILCLTTAIDPETAGFSIEALVKLSKERSRNGAVAFGVLFGADCAQTIWPIRVGDAIDFAGVGK
jgi:uncharacterized protein YcbX